MSPGLTDAPALRALQLESVIGPDNSRNRLEEDVIALFDEFRNPLLRYLSSLGIAFPDCEDVLQETFLALFQHLHRGKSRDNLRGWLFRVAHNLALKRCYRRRRNLEVPTEAMAETSAIDPAPNPEDQASNSQRQRQLLAVVQSLPEQDRQCLVLRAEGLRYREIAGVLDMSLGAVSLSLVRSLARVARCAKHCNL
jgi:RNA polymerase sigma-70 factor (ECF subfamily)